MELMMLGVKTRTFGRCVLEYGFNCAVNSGRNAWMVSIGWSRWVLNRSEKQDGGIVAIGLV